MTKKQAIKLLQRANIPTDFDKLRNYVLDFTILEREINFDKFKGIIETISDYEHTCVLVQRSKVGFDLCGTGMFCYAVDIVDNVYYTEYYN